MLQSGRKRAPGSQRSEGGRQSLCFGTLDDGAEEGKGLLFCGNEGGKESR